MSTTTVRLYHDDVVLVDRLSGLGPDAPFAAKARVLLRKASEQEGISLDGVRTVVRQELERVRRGA